MSTTGKGKKDKSRMPTMYDTSKCQVKFRKPRILQARNRSFDQTRKLSFNHNRMINARLQGVMFRRGPAVGFRNIGISNLEEVMNIEDWPKVESAKTPESLTIHRDKDWESTWGPDLSYKAKWGADRQVHSKEYLYEQDRIPPQIYFQKDAAEGTEVEVKRPIKKKPVVEVVGEPIFASPSTIHEPIVQQTYTPAPSYTPQPSAKDKKRALLFNEYALALMDSGKYERAMTYFRKAQDLDAGEETYRINMKRCREWLDYQRKGGRR